MHSLVRTVDTRPLGSQSQHFIEPNYIQIRTIVLGRESFRVFHVRCPLKHKVSLYISASLEKESSALTHIYILGALCNYKVIDG